MIKSERSSDAGTSSKQHTARKTAATPIKPDDLNEVLEEVSDTYEEIKEPYKYWRDDKFDLFMIDKYEAFPDHDVEEKYVKLVYALKRGQVYEVKDMAKEYDILATTKIRPNGDTILHLCAHYG